jgi:hypothetical protein
MLIGDRHSEDQHCMLSSTLTIFDLLLGLGFSSAYIGSNTDGSG